MALSDATSLWRWPAGACLAAIGAIHLTLVPEHLHEAPYAGLLFIALSAAALLISLLLVDGDHELVWLGAVVLCFAAMGGYVISRSVGLPMMSDDVGQWLDPLGIGALACETAAVVICSHVLWHTRAGRPALA